MTCSPPYSAQAEAGRKVYNEHCYFCHGYSGDARTAAAQYLAVPPRDFTHASSLTPQRIRTAVAEGRPGTAMKSFSTSLKPLEIDAVSAFVSEAFVACGDRNTAYHTPENGWPDHARRNGAAFAFVLGEIAADAAPASLTPAQRQGQWVFVNACISCHEGRRDKSAPLAIATSAHAPGDSHHEDDEYKTAGPHDIPPKINGLTPREESGRTLYSQACASCHAADGTAKNWVGRFLRPSAPDMTGPAYAASFDPSRFAKLTARGLPNTSMPAFETVLTPRQIDAVTAYIERAFIHPNR